MTDGFDLAEMMRSTALLKDEIGSVISEGGQGVEYFCGALAALALVVGTIIGTFPKELRSEAVEGFIKGVEVTLAEADQVVH